MNLSNLANLADITQVLLNENCSETELHQALDAFSSLCSQVTGIKPKPCFDAWADDTFLPDGMAITPEAAALCVSDYRRSVMFIRGTYTALCTILMRHKKTGTTPTILYAGCGPFATLLLPLLHRFEPGSLNILLLDVHQSALDSVSKLLTHFGLNSHHIHLKKSDATRYQHGQTLDLVIAETMQKALEQEPQFAVTANLAPQLRSEGLFIPQEIEVTLCLADLQREKETFKQQRRVDHKTPIDTSERVLLGQLIKLRPDNAAQYLQQASLDAATDKQTLPPVRVEIPELPQQHCLKPFFMTKIRVFENYVLDNYESDLSLPSPCQELKPLVPGNHYTARYLLGNYPKFELRLAQ